MKGEQGKLQVMELKELSKTKYSFQDTASKRGDSEVRFLNSKKEKMWGVTTASSKGHLPVFIQQSFLPDYLPSFLSCSY